ncbi:MAG TPA: response regulator [Planctomycetota bacterium]|nr:response regulator [Planctomycetota bacterium]
MANTILIVEDEAEVRETMRDVLADEGYSVAEASNGREALDWLREHSAPCLVLLDLMMPVMSGREFLDAVKGDPSLRDVSVLVVSAMARDKLARAVADSNAKGYLTKPVQLATLLDAVAEHC